MISEKMANGNTKPFLKWAGGKRSLIRYLVDLKPDSYNNYFEPFLGGGALFFKLKPTQSIISDSNKELINCYIQVRNHPYDIINKLKKLKRNKEYYYTLRDKTITNPIDNAVRLIYLNKCSYNGLWRVNNEGIFNVPYGKYSDKLKIYDEETILNDSRLLKQSKIINCDFENAVKLSNKNDFIYFDPPYTVKHGNNGFLLYNEKIFSWEDQERLAKLCFKMKDKKIKIMISNANVQEIKDLYKDFYFHEVIRTTTISGDIEKRSKVKELIITSYKNQERTLYD